MNRSLYKIIKKLYESSFEIFCIRKKTFRIVFDKKKKKRDKILSKK